MGVFQSQSPNLNPGGTEWHSTKTVGGIEVPGEKVSRDGTATISRAGLGENHRCALVLGKTQEGENKKSESFHGF